jgi:UDP-N-acetyl-2-amino-2-deoxyglucuronate dehydrogenase
LSIDGDDLPTEAAGKRTFRSTLVDGQAFEFSDGFTDLHTACYEKILAGQGFELQETKRAIEIVHRIRNFK